ncbi:lipoprotein-associated protein [Mycoplasma testudineum]|uniref:Lipoprotein-associated protein n=1 Tax=Mycoplasma testudineum TaxID=244584 RepID=A0A4R6IHT8_9MOLU|nr:lipoprotein 17-related variable surface protein [Mycoplasma testudineum]OYD27030.1 hypothetical protein CG473_00030 [Mycoplasma testudineum]TDO21215.1 lipoprotein-associated protein [Mycoplasma testudineum]
MKANKLIFFTGLPLVVGATAAVSIACANPISKNDQDKLNSIIAALNGKTVDLKTQTQLSDFINTINNVNNENIDKTIDDLFGTPISANIGEFAKIEKIEFDKATKSLTVTIKYNNVADSRSATFTVGNLIDPKSNFKVDLATIANLISDKTYNPITRYDNLDSAGWTQLANSLSQSDNTEIIKSLFDPQFSKDLNEASIDNISFSQIASSTTTLNVSIKISNDIEQTKDVSFKLNLPNQIKKEVTQALELESRKLFPESRVTSSTNLLPSEQKVNSFEELMKLVAPAVDYTEDAAITYALFKIVDNDATGTKSVTIRLTKEGIDKDLTWLISGYNTTTFVDTKIVNEEVAKFASLTKKAKQSTLKPSQVTIDSLDSLNKAVSEPYTFTLSKDVTYSFTSKNDDEKGTKVVTVTLTKGDVKATIDVTISGFLTTDKEIANELEVELAKLKPSEEQKASQPDKLPSDVTVSDFASLNLAISAPFAYEQQKDVTYKFESTNDNNTGVKTVKIIATKNSVSKEITITIAGFQSQTEVEKEKQDAADLKTFVESLGTTGETKSKSRRANSSTDYKDLTEFLNNIDKNIKHDGMSATFANFVNNADTGGKTFDITIVKGKSSQVVKFTVSGFSVELSNIVKTLSKANKYAHYPLKATTDADRIKLKAYITDIITNTTSDIDKFFDKLLYVFEASMEYNSVREITKNYELDLSTPVVVSNAFDDKTGQVKPAIKFTLVSKFDTANKQEVKMVVDNDRSDLVGNEYLFWDSKPAVKVEDNIWQVVLVDIDGRELTKSQVALLAQYAGNNFWGKLSINRYAFSMWLVVGKALPRYETVKKIYLYDVNKVKDSVADLSKLDNTYTEYKPSEGYIGGISASVSARENSFKSFYGDPMLNIESETKFYREISGAFILFADKSITGTNAYNGTNPEDTSKK